MSLLEGRAIGVVKRGGAGRGQGRKPVKHGGEWTVHRKIRRLVTTGKDMQIELKQETETETDRGDREYFARAMDTARLQGRLEAFAMAITECNKATRHADGSMGGRDCREIHTAIDILHLDTLRQMKMPNA